MSASIKEAVDAAIEKSGPFLESAKAAGKQFAAGYVPEIYVQDSNRQFDCAVLL